MALGFAPLSLAVGFVCYAFVCFCVVVFNILKATSENSRFTLQTDKTKQIQPIIPYKFPYFIFSTHYTS